MFSLYYCIKLFIFAVPKCSHAELGAGLTVPGYWLDSHMVPQTAARRHHQSSANEKDVRTKVRTKVRTPGKVHNKASIC